jgi:hypothetical protein
MTAPMRASLSVVAAGQAALALGFVLHVGAVTDLWPFEGTSPLSETFIGSILLAAAASTGWCVLHRWDRGLVGVALDYLAILVPLTVMTGWRYAEDPAGDLLGFGVMCLVALAFGVLLLRWARSQQWRDDRPTPRLVVASFAVFVGMLTVVAALLVLRVERVMPWSITADLSTLFGFMFLGAAVYFAYGIAVRRWENAGAQLAGFLAYDAVLVGPFLDRLRSIPPELERSLWIYLTVVVLSGLLATWYLLLDRRTRW